LAFIIAFLLRINFACLICRLCVANGRGHASIAVAITVFCVVFGVSDAKGFRL